jgi:membrane protein YdbS with pleckstrin-like domain
MTQGSGSEPVLGGVGMGGAGLPPAETNPHKPADDREVVYFEGSPQLRGEAGKMLLCLLIAVLVAAGCIYAARQGHKEALIGLVVSVVILLIPWLLAKRVRYRITNYRIDFERGLLGKKIDTMELWHVEDIQFRQSVMGRLLGVGTITVLSHDDTTPRLDLVALPSPRPIFDSLKQRVIAVKRQRGVIKMDIGA